jgi:hypothetical protein
VVTASGPVVAPLGTLAMMLVADWTVKPAGVPSKATLVAPVKSVPMIVTLVPTGPLVGSNDLIVGVASTVSSTSTSSKFASGKQ